MITVARTQRPGVITFVVVLLWIQAISAAVAGVVELATRNKESVLEALG
jgi:hypothetical protein